MPSNQRTASAGKRPTKSNGEKAVARVGKRPVTAPELAKKMGLPNHNGIARALGEAAKQGRLVKTDKGFQQA